MPRDNITSAAQAQAESQITDAVHLIEIRYYDGTSEQVERISTGSQVCDTADYTNNRNPDSDLPADEWAAIGIPDRGSPLGMSAVQETADLRAQAVDLTLDAVDQTFVSIFQNNHFRGRPVSIWKVWFDSANKIDSDMRVWKGFLNDEITVEHSRSEDKESPGTVTISTRSVSHLARLTRTSPVKTNPASHNDMLARAGLTADDTSMETVAGLADKEVFWAREAPQRGGGSRGGNTGGDGGEGDGHGEGPILKPPF